MRTLLLCLLISCFAVTAQAKTLRIATGEFTPTLSSTAKHKGFVNHVVKEIFSRKGYEVEFDFLPWKRAIKQTERGDYHAISWLRYSDERAEQYFISDEVFASGIHFFYEKSRFYDFDWKELSDLDQYRIGVSRSYHYSDEFDAYRKANAGRVEVMNSDEQNLKRLLRRRIDIFPVDLLVGLGLLRTQFDPSAIHQLAYHPKPLVYRPGFIMFPKSRPDAEELNRIFNEGLKELHEDGTYDRMYEDLLSGDYSN